MIGIEEYESNTREILKAFLMHGESQFKDKRKLDGYGLKMEDFNHEFKNGNDESYSSATKRMFTPRKNELLSKHYITSIRSKGKQTKYYSITPVGIAYLFQKFKPPGDLVTAFFDAIIKYLIFYHEATKPYSGYAKLSTLIHKTFERHSGYLEEKEIISLSLIFKTMDYIKITHYGENETVVDLTYPLYFDTEVYYGRYLFTHGKNKTPLFLEKPMTSEAEEFQSTGHSITSLAYNGTTEVKIYQKISTFIIRAFFNESVSNKIIKLGYLKNNTHASKSKITQLEKELKNIPNEYLVIADDFYLELRSILLLNIEEIGKIRDGYFKQLLSE